MIRFLSQLSRGPDTGRAKGAGMASERDARRRAYLDKTAAETDALEARGVMMGGNAFSPVLLAARCWLDAYFAGERPGVADVPLAPRGTAFQRRVWDALLAIPYGETRTYGELAVALGSSARAVGSAVGKNPISVIVPCHRVLGAGGSLTGYAGGLERKRALLALERAHAPERPHGAYVNSLFRKF